MKGTITWPLGVALGSVALLSGQVARADAKQDCNAAYEETQTLREKGKLIDAHTRALACSAATCSPHVVKECEQWLAEIDASTPTVVFSAVDASGADTAAVRVSVDGRVFRDTLDGKSVPVDPGKRVVRFELAGSEPIEQTLLIRQGEKNRSVVASFKGKQGGGAARFPQRMVGVALLGAGGAGILAGAVAGALVLAQHGSLASACTNGMCPLTEKGDLDAYHAKSVASTVGFVAGGALAVSGLIVFLTAPKAPPPAAAGVRPYLGLGTVGAWGRF